MKIALLVAMFAATGATAQTYNCEGTHLNSPEFPQSSAALLVQDGALVLSNGDSITKMPITSDGLVFDIYEVSPDRFAVFWPSGRDAVHLHIMRPKSGSAPRLDTYICKP
jgi:hypothetical protein